MLITLQYCIDFAIYQHESATGIHVFPSWTPLPLPFTVNFKSTKEINVTKIGNHCELCSCCKPKDLSHRATSIGLSFFILGCKEYNQSDFSIDHLVMYMVRVISCAVGKRCLLWPVHSLGKMISFCPASLCTPRPNLPVTLDISWLPTFAFQSPVMKRKRTRYTVVPMNCD